MGKGIMERKCTAGNFTAENLPGKSFEFCVFGNSMGGKISGSDAGKKSQDKEADDKKRCFFL